MKAAVLHLPTVNPLDTATILAEIEVGGRLECLRRTTTVMPGRAGEAMADLLMRDGVGMPLRGTALPDAVFEAGVLPALHDRSGLSR